MYPVNSSCGETTYLFSRRVNPLTRWVDLYRGRVESSFGSRDREPKSESRAHFSGELSSSRRESSCAGLV